MGIAGYLWQHEVMRPRGWRDRRWVCEPPASREESTRRGIVRLGIPAVGARRGLAYPELAEDLLGHAARRWGGGWRSRRWPRRFRSLRRMRRGQKAARSPARRGGWGEAGFRGARWGGAGGSRDAEWRATHRRSPGARGGAARAAWQLGGVRAGGWAACRSRSLALRILLGFHRTGPKRKTWGGSGGRFLRICPVRLSADRR